MVKFIDSDFVNGVRIDYVFEFTPNGQRCERGQLPEGSVMMVNGSGLYKHGDEFPAHLPIKRPETSMVMGTAKLVSKTETKWDRKRKSTN